MIKLKSPLNEHNNTLILFGYQGKNGDIGGKWKTSFEV